MFPPFQLMCAASLLGGSFGPQEPTQIAWTPKVGSSHYYKVQMATSSPTEETGFTLSAEMKQTVEEIAKDGTITAKRRWTKFSIAIKGQDVGNMPSPPDAIDKDTFAPDGDLIDETPINADGTPKVSKKKAKDSGDDDEDGSGADGPQSLPVFPVVCPAKPVVIGDKWDEELPQSVGGKKFPKKEDIPAVTYTYAGEETALTVPCYRIDVDITPGRKLPLSGYGHLWISKEDGSIVREELKMSAAKADKDPAPAFDMQIKVDLDD